MTGIPEQRPSDDSGLPGEALYCRTCHRPLNPHLHNGQDLVYRHPEEMRGGTVDHRPVPVPVTEIPAPVFACDFCCAPDAVWIYAAADQHTQVPQVTRIVVAARDYRDRHHAAHARRVDTEHAYTSVWGERWASCQPCSDLIEARDLYGLIGRVVDAMPAKYTRGNRLVRVRGELAGIYQHLFDTLTPGRGRITPDHPRGLWEPPPGAPA